MEKSNYAAYNEKMGLDYHQVGGDHYEQMAIQPIDYILANNLGFCEGNVVKYISRWRSKNGVEDLLKAKDYINRLIKVCEDGKLQVKKSQG